MPGWRMLTGVVLAAGLLACPKGGAPPVPPPGPPAAAPASLDFPPAPQEAARAARPARQPPLQPCEALGDPLDVARLAYDEGGFERALSCAAQASAHRPDLPLAHSERGAALSALHRLEEAQLAYARALALAPDHPDALLGAAHLYAVSLPSTREHDELAVLYAERGRGLALGAGDARLAVQFSLVSAMALNDLGRAHEALERADEVLRAQPGSREAAYERAAALFELCRFVEAKAAFTALLADPERGAHSHHHLGLILERQGRLAQAERHFAVAKKRSPKEFPEPSWLSPEEFAKEVKRAVAELPEDMRRDLVGIPVTPEELPAEEDLLGGDPPLSPSILGLFRGPPLGERCDVEPGRPCRSVALYRRNLARAVLTKEELLEQIRITLLHEVGHLRGEDDHELAARGLE